jgi:hypothetical protein
MQFKPFFRPIRFMAANKGSTSTEIFYLWLDILLPRSIDP